MSGKVHLVLHGTGQSSGVVGAFSTHGEAVRYVIQRYISAAGVWTRLNEGVDVWTNFPNVIRIDEHTVYGDLSRPMTGAESKCMPET